MMKTAKKQPTIDSVIEQLLVELSSHKSTSEEYAKIIQNIDGLCKARSYKRDSRWPIETLIYAGTSLLEILFVLNFERLNVLPKAIGYVLRLRP